MSLFGIKLSLILAPLIITGLATPAACETIVRKTVTYFSISGSTAQDLDRELLMRGPVSANSGRRHPGATKIRFNGSATFISKGSRCYIGGAKVELYTKLMLPKWSNRKRADRDMKLVWDTLSSDIKRHEERHAEIARNHARALEKQILSLPYARSCPTLKAKVSKLSEQAMLDHDADQKRFDRVEAANFDSRMIRLLKHRMASTRSQ